MSEQINTENENRVIPDEKKVDYVSYFSDLK